MVKCPNFGYVVLAEVSDQNFVGDEVEGEKESKRNKVKRQKALVIDAKGNDQVRFYFLLL